MRDRREQGLVSAHAPMETTEDYNKDAFYDELPAVISKTPCQQAAIIGIDANAKMGLEQQSYVLEKWYCAGEQTSNNGLVDFCEEINLIIASTLKRSQTTFRKDNTPLSDIQKSCRCGIMMRHIRFRPPSCLN
ncbi:hypothetical protein RB195_023540 [Necator americanus]|uniref:Uncharacterized protein n=1 Tax=Necator americanus TaxID=51031 RepID=A0ABR1EJM3_NECAM